MIIAFQWRRDGGKGGHPPRVALRRGGIWTAKIWYSEIWPLLANCHLHYRQWFCTSFNIP